MSAASGTPNRFDWTILPTVGLGIFVGSFWLLYGFLMWQGRPAAGWQYAVTLAPGAAVLLLVTLARYSPVPYGTGLIALGVSPLLLVGWHSRWEIRLAFGLPLVAVGIAFLIWRNHFQD